MVTATESSRIWERFCEGCGAVQIVDQCNHVARTAPQSEPSPALRRCPLVPSCFCPFRRGVQTRQMYGNLLTCIAVGHVARGGDTGTNNRPINKRQRRRPRQQQQRRRNCTVGRERLRYNTNKVAAFVRRREQLTVFLEWAKKSAQLAAYVVKAGTLTCFAWPRKLLSCASCALQDTTPWASEDKCSWCYLSYR